MDILIYILELIKFRKEIGIDGLGTFYKQKTPGRYDAETHTFLPPSYTLTFTPAVSETNNLAAFISKKRHVSLDTANYFISQFVAEIKKELAKGGVYELQGLGKLSSQESELKFYPATAINSGFDFFALPPITTDLPKVATQDQPKSEETNQINQAQHFPLIETVEEAFVEDEVTAIEETANVQPEIAEKINLAEAKEQQKEISTELQETAKDEPKVESTEKEEEIAEENRVEEENPGGFPEIDAPEQLENEFENFHLPEELTTSEIEKEPVAEEKEADEQEVFDEIVEINSGPNEIPTNDKHLEDDWNFETQEEKIVELKIGEGKTEPSNSDVTTPPQKPASIIQEIDSELSEDHFSLDSGAVVEKPLVNITTPTKDWDFDDSQEENTFISNDIEYSNEEVVQEQKGMPPYVKGILIFLVIAVGAIVLYFVNPNIFNAFVKNDTNPDDKIAVPIAEDSRLKTQADSLSFADSIMNNAEKVGLKVEPAKDTIKVQTTAKPVNSTTYEVIAAALTSKEAVPFIARLKRKGIVANIVDDMPGKLKKISIGSFNNPDSAQKYAAYYRKEWKNNQIYAIPVKHK